MLGNFSKKLSSADFFSKLTISKNSFRITISGSTKLLFADFFQIHVFQTVRSGIPSVGQQNCRLLAFYKITFSKISFAKTTVAQTVWIKIRPDTLSGLICVQTVLKGYQQTTLAGNKS